MKFLFKNHRKPHINSNVVKQAHRGCRSPLFPCNPSAIFTRSTGKVLSKFNDLYFKWQFHDVKIFGKIKKNR